MYFSKDAAKSIASILNVTLIIVPLISVLFGAVHYYNSKEFMLMLLSQPVKRSKVFWAEYIALAVSLSAGFLAGAILPLLLFGLSKVLVILALSGVILSFVFSAISIFFSVLIDEKVKGIGVLFFIWLLFSVLYDGLLLGIYFAFNDFPLEKVTIFLTLLNPVDIARIMVLLNLDLSAMLGYNGAVFVKFFGKFTGIGISLLFSLGWAVIPALIALKKFNRKNF